MHPPTCPTPQPLTTRTTTHLLSSLLSITTYTPKLTTALQHPSLFPDDSTPQTPTLLLEGARLANQLVEDLILFDTEGLRAQCGVSRLLLLRVGVEARAFVELYEGFVRDFVDGMIGGAGEKEVVVRRRNFLEFWMALERGLRGLVELLV